MVTNAAAANTPATISKAAGASGVKHVVTSVSFTIASDATGGTPFTGTVNLRDGGTGAGTILGTWYIGNVTAIGASNTFALSGLNIPGSAATATTLEFTASATHTLESVTLTGYDVI